MLFSKNSPVGLDWYIQQLQTKLHSSLRTAWGTGGELLTTTEYECYGRCYRNKKDDGYVAEVYTTGNDYKEVYWNDKLSAISFFGISDSIKTASVASSTTDIHLVFFVNLAKLKPEITHRADEEVRMDVYNAIGKISNGFTFKGVELWIENVLKEYPGSRRNDRLKVVDMHPVHCFRFDFSLLYNQNQNCQTIKI